MSSALVVEDDSANMKLTTLFLHSAGQALTRLGATHPELAGLQHALLLRVRQQKERSGNREQTILQSLTPQSADGSLPRQTTQQNP